MTPRKFIEECFNVFKILSINKKSNFYIERQIPFNDNKIEIIFDMEEINNKFYSYLDLRFYIEKARCLFMVEPSEDSKRLYSILFEIGLPYNSESIYHRKTTRKVELFKYTNDILRFFPETVFFQSSELKEMFSYLKLEII